jgi:hypothetical protein
VRLEFHSSKIGPDDCCSGELDEISACTTLLADCRRGRTQTGNNRLHSLVGLLRQSVGRLAGYGIE